MTRLVHLNGPPGIGKSTIARRYIAEHPLAFCLDIDGIRRLLGGWDAREEESGRLARRMALRMMEEHLSSGFDVVVPQYVARAEFVHQMRRVATDTGADFYEIVLTDSAQAARDRFDARANDPVWLEHHADAARQIAKVGGFEGMYDRLMSCLAELPGAAQLATSTGRIDDAYAAVLAAIG